ncbi:MAG: tripartite tricarboxylate transporter TctB family protein [Pseudomonadota bacterium]
MSESPRADRWFAVLLTLFGAAATYESWRMPRLEHLGIDPMSAPGLTPGLLGLVLTILGLLLAVRSARPIPEGAGTAAAQGGWGRLAITLALCLVYAVGLLGRLPFPLATALFVGAFVAIFLYGRHTLLTVAALSIAMAVGVAASVTLLFERVFLVRLP